MPAKKGTRARSKSAGAKPQVIVVAQPKAPVRRKRQNKGAQGAITGFGAYNKSGIKKEKTIGQRVGGQIGSAIGLGAEHLFKWLTGMGDYEVKQNALLVQDPPPMINQSNKGGTIIRHREYLRDIFTSTTPGAFQLDNFYINPGDANTFPWLSQIAPNYEQYQIEGMIFEYRSMSADALNSTNTALGSVVMATNYDSLDTLFQNKSEMENYEFGASCKPSVDMMHPIECAPRQTTLTELYTRAGGIPAGADRRFYDLGNFQIATVGFQAASVNIGELWVSYQVRLMKPKLYDALGLEIGVCLYNASAYTNAVPLGSAGQVLGMNSIGASIDPVGNTISFPRLGIIKTYSLMLEWNGSAAVIAHPTYIFTNCVQSTYTTSTVTIAPAAGETASRVIHCLTVRTVANLPPFITISNVPTLPSSGNGLLIRISVIPNNA